MYNQFLHMPDREAMLSSPVRSLILRLSLPSLTAMLATGLCTLLDGLLLARQQSTVSAAAGVCFPLIAAQQAVGFTLGMGAGSHVSRAIGKGEEDSARQAAATALFAALLLGLLLMGAGRVFLTPLLGFLGAPADTLPHAAAYAAPLLYSFPFACSGLVLSSLLRAQGRTDLNLLAYLSASVVGAFLSFLLILRLDARGAGLSLLAREALACLILAVASLRCRGLLRLRLRDVTLQLWVIPAVMRSGLPTLLRQGAMSLSGAMLSRAAARFGPTALAGIGLAARVLALITSAAIGFGQGFAPVCGVCHGAGKTDRVREAYRFSLRVMTVSLSVLGALLFFFCKPLLSLLGSDAQVAAFAARVIRAQSPVLACQGAVILMNMLTQSRGETLRASVIATSRQGIFLIPLILTLPRLFGEAGLILCQSAADVLALGLSLLVLKIDRKANRD